MEIPVTISVLQAGKGFYIYLSILPMVLLSPFVLLPDVRLSVSFIIGWDWFSLFLHLDLKLDRSL